MNYIRDLENITFFLVFIIITFKISQKKHKILNQLNVFYVNISRNNKIIIINQANGIYKEYAC